MRITLISCLFIATYAGVIHDNDVDSDSSDIVTTTNAPFFDSEKLLEKISASCIDKSDFKLMTGGAMSWFLAAMASSVLTGRSVSIIANEEFRAALNFGSSPSWNCYNGTEPSEEELASATTLEEYYTLKETHSFVYFLDDMFVVETNMPPAIAFLDKKFPSIRILFRRKIQEIVRSNGGEINKEDINRWISELNLIRSKVSEGFSKAVKNLDRTTGECLKQ